MDGQEIERVRISSQPPPLVIEAEAMRNSRRLWKLAEAFSPMKCVNSSIFTNQRFPCRTKILPQWNKSQLDYGKIGKKEESEPNQSVSGQVRPVSPQVATVEYEFQDIHQIRAPFHVEVQADSIVDSVGFLRLHCSLRDSISNSETHDQCARTADTRA